MTKARKPLVPKRIPGTNPDQPLRLCRSCYYELPLSYYGGIKSTSDLCIVCRDIEREAMPWTEREARMLHAAARRVLDLWPRYLDWWTEDDLNRWRELVAAAGREGGVPLSVLGRKSDSVPSQEGHS